jgi:hypothetical protein
MCRGRHKEDRTSIGSAELCQEGIERVEGVHRRSSISSLGKEEHMKFCEVIPRGH